MLFPWLFVGSAVGGPLCATGDAAHGLVINEILPDPVGADVGSEWVEILNHTGLDVVLDGFTLAAGTSTWSDSEPFPEGTLLEAGMHMVIATAPGPGIDLVVGGFTLGNASSNADAVQLRDCLGVPVDTVVYGSDALPDQWIDDTGTVATSLAERAGPGASLGRDPDGQDSDASGLDFAVFSAPTPGTANDEPPVDCGGPGSGVVINELFPNPVGEDQGSEWVELFHAGSVAVDMTGWQLQAGTSSYTTLTTFEELIEPGQRWLVGGEQVVDADLVSPMTLGNATQSADAIRLVDCAGFPSDTVVYGGPNSGDPPFVDDTGEIATRLAPAPSEGAALQRISDGFDTDDNQTDLAVTSAPTPGGPNPVQDPIVCVPSAGNVSINEILPDPAGDDATGEFIELYNRGTTAAQIDGWSMSSATRGFDARSIVLGGGLTIPAKGFFVIGGEALSGADVHTVVGLGNGSDTDGLRLFDCQDDIVDTVVYGDPGNQDGIVDDHDRVVEPYGDPGADESLARVVDGQDTDAAADWSVRPRPTPGAPNLASTGSAPIEDPLSGRGCLGPGDPPTGMGDPGHGCGHLGGPGAGWLLGLLAICWRARARPPEAGAPS